MVMLRKTSSSRPSSVCSCSICHSWAASPMACASAPLRAALRESPHRHVPVFVIHHGHPLDQRHLVQLRGHRARGHAFDPQRHRPGPLRFLPQLLRRAVGHNLAAVNDDRPRADRIHFLQDVRREDDRLLLAHPPDQLPHLVLLIRIQPVRRLVQHQHVGVVNDGLGETGAVAITLGERLDALVQHRFQEAHLDHAVDGLLPRVAAQAADFRREIEEPIHRHVRVGRRVFRQVADQPLAPRIGCSTMSKPPTVTDAAGRRQEAGDHAHGGGLAGAVGPKEAQHLAPVHRERDVVHGPFGPEDFCQILNLNHITCLHFLPK